MRLAHINRDSNRKPKVDLAALNARLKQEMAKYKDEPEGMEEEVETEAQRKKK